MNVNAAAAEFSAYSSLVCRALWLDHKQFSADVSNFVARITSARGSDRLSDIVPGFFDLIEEEFQVHFNFEEENLFPIVRQAGRADVSDRIAHEHQIMRDTASSLMRMYYDTFEDGITESLPDAFWTNLSELHQLLLRHIEFEDMVFAPVIAATIDSQLDASLADDLLTVC